VSRQQATAGCHAYRLLKAAVKAPLGYGGAHCACKVDDSSASCMQMYESSSSSEDLVYSKSACRDEVCMCMCGIVSNCGIACNHFCMYVTPFVQKPAACVFAEAGGTIESNLRL
jgi:hypothetical protein